MQTLVLTEIYLNTYAYVNSQAILSDLNPQNHLQLNVDFQNAQTPKFLSLSSAKVGKSSYLDWNWIF